MPPIFGILNTRLLPVHPEMMQRMMDDAVYIKPRQLQTMEIKNGFYAVAALTENALVAGKDCMAVNGPWVIVADACLFKRDELLKALGRDEEMIRSAENYDEGKSLSDTGIILAAWMKWGKDCVKYLYGDFAFVIHNTETGAIYCARDHLGVRPFFYAINGDMFVFSSELRLVLSSLDQKPQIRTEYLMDTLVTIVSSKTVTAYEGILRLEPAHDLFMAENKSHFRQYWEPHTKVAIRLENEAKYIELFRGKLISAVKIRSSGVKKTGSELSGGLDSSAITGIAAEIGLSEGNKLTAFSNVFPDNSNFAFRDEQEFMLAMNDFKSFSWKRIDKLNQRIPELLKYSLEIQGGFIQQNFSIFNRGLYEAAQKSGIQVLLSGFGGDELVSARIAMPWSELLDNSNWRIMLDEIFFEGIRFKAILKLSRIVLRYLKSIILKDRIAKSKYSKELLDRRFANLPLQPSFALKYNLKKLFENKFTQQVRKYISVYQANRIRIDHLPQRMEYCYCAAAQYGIEYRYPLLDIDLIETMLAFPPWLKIHHGINRFIFRQAIQGFVPEKIRQRNSKSLSTIPQTYNSLINDQHEILDLIRRSARFPFLEGTFDLSKFPTWYDKLVKKDKEEMNYSMPGAFYNYLMILLYFGDGEKGTGTRDYEERELIKEEKNKNAGNGRNKIATSNS